MEYRRDVWFSPRKILSSHFELQTEHAENIKKLPQYKTIKEAVSTAIMLLGIQKIQNRDYWLQLVNPTESTPDVRTASHVKELDNFPLYYQDVEVVTYEDHSSENLVDFLKRTKLSDLKAYQEKTIVLCMIDRTIQTEPWNVVSEKLSKENKDILIYLLGRTDPTDLKYQLACIYPKFEHAITFDAVEEMQKDTRGSMKFERGTTRRENKINETFKPF